MITICRLISTFGRKVPFVCKSTQATVRNRFFLSTFERRSIKSYKKYNVYFSNKPENKNPVLKPVDSAKLSESILKRLDDIRRHYTWKGKLLFFSVFAFITMAVSYLYLFGDVMRNKMAEEVTSVASKSLADDQLINDAEQLSKEVLHGILHDSDMKDYSTKFVSSVLSNPETRKSATELILSVLNDEEVLRITTDKLSAILLSLLKSDEIKDIVLSQLETILQDPGVKLSVQKLLYDVTSTPEVQEMMADFFRQVLASDTVTHEGSELGRKITNEVISDKMVQQRAGAAIWSAVKYSVTPRLFSAKEVQTDVADIHDLLEEKSERQPTNNDGSIKAPTENENLNHSSQNENKTENSAISDENIVLTTHTEPIEKKKDN